MEKNDRLLSLDALRGFDMLAESAPWEDRAPVPLLNRERYRLFRL
jgi:hypothetical protein